MRGAIIGDIIGSAFIDSPSTLIDIQLLKPFSAYTDDTVLSLATAEAILKVEPYEVALRNWVRSHPKAGYRESFLNWALSNKDHNEYDSRGDGAARRISPIGFSARTIEEALSEAKKSTCVTHSAQTKIKAAQAVAGAIFLAKEGSTKKQIRVFLKQEFGYDLPAGFDKVTAVESIEKYDSPAPAAFMVFLDSTDYEDAIRKAIGLGGPTNTIASITGGLAQAYYKHIPKALLRKTLSRLTFDMEELLETFEAKYFDMDKEKDVEEIPIGFR